MNPARRIGMIIVRQIFPPPSSEPARLSGDDIVIGRHAAGAEPDLDLGAFPQVSRRHARVWLRDGGLWIEDLGSTHGTLVNGKPLEYKREIRPSDEVTFGGVTVSFKHVGEGGEEDEDIEESAETVFIGAESNLQADSGEGDALRVSDAIDARYRASLLLPGEGQRQFKRLNLLYELPMRFAEVAELESLFHLILDKVVEMIDGARRGALLIIDRETGKLALRASIPEDNPPVSRTLIQRAVREMKGLIWSREEEADLTRSMVSLGIQTGMYAPLVWHNEIMGVLCVDNPDRSTAFGREDLQFLMAVGHYAAVAVANRELQAHLEHNATVLERLLTNFSPQLRENLLAKARRGSLQPGGEISQVTLLMSDIRGFTRLTAGMDAAQVVEMLNEYFSALIDSIFRHDGTIDKFIGDAILAVFGSPEHDPDQHQKAVKAALAMQEAMDRVNEARRKRGDVTCEIGIGLHHGEVLHGFIGAKDRLEFTVIGDPVNRTSRYCTAAAAGEIVMSPGLWEQVADCFEAEKIEIPTKHEGEFEAYRIVK